MKKLLFRGLLALSLLLPIYTPAVSQQILKPKVEHVKIIKDGMYDNHNAYVDESKYSLEDILESVETIEHEISYQIDYTDLEGKLNSTTKKVKMFGSGVVIEKKDNKAYILTNNHVVEENKPLNFKLPDSYKFVKAKKVSEKISIVKNWLIFQTRTNAEKVVSNSSLDMALLEVDDSKAFKKFPYKVGNSNDLRVGDFVWIMGNPLGIEDYTLKGNVSKTKYDSSNYFMIGCAVQPGYSGGIVVAIRDGEYELVGLVTATLVRPDKDSVDALSGYGIALKINPLMNLINGYFDSLKLEEKFSSE